MYQWFGYNSSTKFSGTTLVGAGTTVIQLSTYIHTCNIQHTRGLGVEVALLYSINPIGNAHVEEDEEDQVHINRDFTAFYECEKFTLQASTNTLETYTKITTRDRLSPRLRKGPLLTGYVCFCTGSPTGVLQHFINPAQFFS